MDRHLDDVDWAATFHSRGSARDMPRLLRALVGTDPQAFVDGYVHLWATTHREGHAWPATAPTALAVAGFLLDHPLLGPDDPSLRDAMLAYLQTVGAAADLGDRETAIRTEVARRAAELAAWTARCIAAADAADADAAAGEWVLMWTDASGPGNVVLDQARLACFDAVPEILPRVLPHLASARPKRRAYAAGAVGELARHPSAA